MNLEEFTLETTITSPDLAMDAENYTVVVQIGFDAVEVIGVRWEHQDKQVVLEVEGY